MLAGRGELEAVLLNRNSAVNKRVLENDLWL